MLAGANDKPEGKQRLSSTERRAAIVRTAMNLFAQNGFRGTTTRELAAAVGVSEPVLYQHFPSKSDLYTAIVEQMVSDVAEGFRELLLLPNENVPEEEYFQQLGEQLLEWYLDGARNMRLLLFSALEGHELAQLWHSKATVHFAGAVEGYLKSRAERQGYEIGNATVAARAFIGMVSHYGMISSIFYCDSLEHQRKEIVRQFVQIYLNGIRGRRADGAAQR